MVSGTSGCNCSLRPSAEATYVHYLLSNCFIMQKLCVLVSCSLTNSMQSTICTVPGMRWRRNLTHYESVVLTLGAHDRPTTYCHVPLYSK